MGQVAPESDNLEMEERQMLMTPEQQAELDRDAEQKRYEYFRTLGLDEKHAGLLSAASAKELEWNGVRLIYKATGNPAIDDASAADHYKAEFPLLFPEKKTTATEDQITPKVDPALVASALAGSLTARGQVFQALNLNARDPNSIAQLDAFLATEQVKATNNTPADNPADLQKAGGRNPWSGEPGAWNLTRQMQIFRSDPSLAARLAKAANSTIGAARPTRRSA